MYQNPITSFFPIFLFSLFLPCKYTLLNDYDEILNYNDLKCDTYEIFDTFLFINFDGDQNLGEKGTPIRTRSFSFWVVQLKRFSP
jgi:hypothetical protein